MAVSTTESFLDLLAASNLLAPAEIEELRAGAEDDPKQFATRLAKLGKLTRWQAQQLLGGRTKFFLGKYKLLESIGQGGMGTVLKAEQSGIGRVVALKLMSKAVLKNPNAVNRFLREIRSAAALNHPNIVAAYDADSEGGKYFLVMEYVNGRDLKEWIKKHRQLPIDWACECIRQAAEGLQHAHEHGMIHRDIKPANLLVVTEQDGTKPTIKILDMGLARFTSENSIADEGLTQTGQVMGTPDYISPEQARNTRDADIRSDIFSLGCTLFELLAGQVPFGGQNVMEKLMARAVQDAPRVRSLRPDVPPELDQIVARMLSRNVAARFQTPGEVARALAPFATGGVGAARLVPVESELETTATVETAPDPTLNEFLDQLGDTAGPFSAPSSVARSAGKPRSTGKQKLQPWMLIGGGTCGVLVLAGVLMTLLSPKGTRDGVQRKPAPARAEAAGKTRKPSTTISVDADAQRDLAKWVLQEGGNVAVWLNDQQLTDAGQNSSLLDPNLNRERIVEKENDLPTGPLRITGISFADQAHITSIGLRRLKNAPHVQRLSLRGTQISGDGLELLAGMKDLVSLDLQNTPVRGMGFAHLKGMPKLAELYVGMSDVGDRALEKIGEFTALQRLGLEQTAITDEGMSALSGLTELRWLSLVGTRLTDEGLRPLSRMPLLKELALDGTSVTDAGLAHLEKCNELSYLGLVGTRVTGSGLSHLRNSVSLGHIGLAFCPVVDEALRQLKPLNPGRIDLNGTMVTDAGLPHLAHMSNLTFLDLSQTQVSDAAIPVLAKLSNLQIVNLTTTNVTAEGAAKLRRALPNCQVIP